MKRLILGTIIISVLMLVGCNDGVTNKQINTPTITDEKKVNSETSKTEQIAPSNYVKTYKDEIHKKIQYDKLLINFDDYHVVSDTLSNNNETFKCEIDKGKVLPETHMTITIQAIKKQEFLDTKSIIAYLEDMSPDYTGIRIYNNVSDSSGITSLYIVKGSRNTNYVVCYRDDSYLIESDYSGLDSYLFEAFVTANYEAYKQKIECANSFIAHVNEAINRVENKVEYDIIQGKGGTKYSAELSFNNKEYINNFALKNENGENLLALSAAASGSNEDIAIKFLDVNMDGYVDIQFLEVEGTMNNSYALYVWDDSAKNFVKVKCDEMLSYFEVHDGYLQNWQKESANSGVIQKLVWNKNTLIKESEEQYHAD